MDADSVDSNSSTPKAGAGRLVLGILLLFCAALSAGAAAIAFDVSSRAERDVTEQKDLVDRLEWQGRYAELPSARDYLTNRKERVADSRLVLGVASAGTVFLGIGGIALIIGWSRRRRRASALGAPLAAAAIAATFVACSSPTQKQADETAKASSTSEARVTTAPASTGAAEVVPATTARALDPLPLTLALPASAKVEKASEKSVFVEQGDTKLDVEAIDQPFDVARKAACDPLVCKLVRWVKEDKDIAIAEWGGMMPGYRAFRFADVGGKKYLCQNVGPSADAPDAAEAIVKPCADLKPESPTRKAAAP